MPHDNENDQLPGYPGTFRPGRRAGNARTGPQPARDHAGHSAAQTPAWRPAKKKPTGPKKGCSGTLTPFAPLTPGVGVDSPVAGGSRLAVAHDPVLVRC